MARSRSKAGGAGRRLAPLPKEPFSRQRLARGEQDVSATFLGFKLPKFAVPGEFKGELKKVPGAAKKVLEDVLKENRRRNGRE